MVITKDCMLITMLINWREVRSQLAIQGRWSTIQRAVNKFCGFKASKDRRNESRKNEQDRIEDAIKMYEQVEPFHFMHCWKILRDEPKWNEKILEINNNDAGKGAATSVRNTTPLDSEGQSQHAGDERPEGEIAQSVTKGMLSPHQAML